MNVKELLALPQYGIRSYPPYNEEHVEIVGRHGNPSSAILTEEEAVEHFGNRRVWIAFHAEGTMDNPVHGEHVFSIGID